MTWLLRIARVAVLRDVHPSRALSCTTRHHRPSASPSYDSGSTNVPLLEVTTGDLLERTASRFPDHPALVVPHQDVRLSWSELNAKVDALARGFKSLGLQPRDRLGLWLPNYAEWIYTQLATAKLGVIQVNINPAYRTSELEYALHQSGCRVLVTRSQYLTSEYGAMAAAVAPNLPELESIFHIDSPEWGSLFVDEAAAAPAAVESLHTHDPINIQFTSGTTGRPKGATLTHHNILNNGRNIAQVLSYTEKDSVCIPVPFYHCFGQVIGNLACVASGATMVVPAPTFDPVATLDACEAEGCTSLYGVPTMFLAMLSQPNLSSRKLSSLRTGVMAGSVCPMAVMQRVINDLNMKEVTICYGMTESSPVSTQTRASDPLDLRVSSVGKVHPHTEAKIVDPDTNEIVPRGTVGEYCTRGYHVMEGYWAQEAETKKVIQPDGWLYSGDLAIMNEDGYVSIVGRLGDMIIRGGENIYPAEIEEFLYTHSAVADVQVVGVPDPKFGEEVLAWVILKPEAQDTTPEDIREFCRDKIAHFKIPRYINIVAEFPLTVTGKVKKNEIRKAAVEKLGL